MRNNPSDSVDGFLGYANQIYRGLGYLIDKLSTVLIEKDDDVVVSDDYGYLFLEQVKEKEKVIFRVTAPDFLKTLKNWVNLYINKKDKFNERTKCILTLVCRNEVDDDLILFNNAKNMEDCEEAYHKLIQRIKNIKDKIDLKSVSNFTASTKLFGFKVNANNPFGVFGANCLSELISIQRDFNCFMVLGVSCVILFLNIFSLILSSIIIKF